VENKIIYNDQLTEKIAEHYKDILSQLGENASREGLEKTPERVAKSLQYLTQGYDQDPDALLNSAIFHEEYSEMVIVKDIEVYSMCEHHMLPFFGNAYARRLQVQERLTLEIRDAIQRVLDPKGVAVVIECAHMCMQMRGVQKQNSTTTSSAFTGLFMKNETTRKEFINLIQAKLH
jgi:GTP cyclohydrolase IA